MGWARVVCDARDAWSILRMELEAKAHGRGALSSQRKALMAPR